MQRREFIKILGTAAAAGPFPAAAQVKPLPVVAFVMSGAQLSEIVGSDPALPTVRAFVHELHNLGWIDGRTVIIERRSPEGDLQRVPALFADLIARGVDVIMLASPRWLHDAAQRQTRTIPTVTVFVDDPVAAGLIKSLARPGGNLTGLTGTTGPEFQRKRLQLLHELSPQMTRVAFLAQREVLAQDQGVIELAGVNVIPVQVDLPEQFEEAFATVLSERADALMVALGGLNYGNYRRIVTFAAQNRLPAIYGFREAVEAGGLMSYGASVPGLWRQAAGIVDRILKGAKPGDIPVEQPITFGLAINLKTVRALGLVVQPSILARADDVIE